MKQAKSGGSENSQSNEKTYWQSCMFLRNLPSGISQSRVTEWVAETFRQQPSRVAFADEGATDPFRSGSYVVKLTPQSMLSVFASQGHKIQHIFPLSLFCEAVRSEEFAKRCFSESNELHGGEERSLANRCLIVRQLPGDSFSVSNWNLVQLFQGCLGEEVKQAVIIKRDPRRTKCKNTKMIVEFISPDSVACIMLTFDEESSSLDIPVKIQAATKRSGNFAKKCLVKVEKLQNDGRQPVHSEGCTAQKREKRIAKKAQANNVLLGNNLK